MSRIDTYLTYLEQKPGDRFALYSLALEYKKAGDVEAAERTFGDLLTRHPGSGAGHFQLGLLLAEAGRTAEAEAAWRRGLAALKGSSDPEARRSIGEIERALDEICDD